MSLLLTFSRSFAATVITVTLMALAGCNPDRAQQLAPGQLSMIEMEKRHLAELRKSADKEAVLLAEARTMTLDQEKTKLAALQAAPSEAALYYQLMRYYEFKSDFKGKSALILWYIEHAPVGEVRPWNISPNWDPTGYEIGKQFWLKNAGKDGAGPDVYDRAAAFLEGGDKALAEELLLAGRKAYPDDKRWPGALGMHYAQVLLGSAEPRTEYNVFRTVSAKEASSPYARSVRARLSVSNDALILAQTAQGLMMWGRRSRGGVDLESARLAAEYAGRASELQPDSELPRLMKFRVEQLHYSLRLQELMRLPQAARAGLSNDEKMMVILRELQMALGKENAEDVVVEARELLDLAARVPPDSRRGEAIYEANIQLGKAALRSGDKKTSVQYMLAAADSPGSEQLRQTGAFSFGIMDMNLMRALVDWGERDAVARFLDRMAPKTNRTDEFLEWAAQIRKGINPDLRPTLSGCLKGPC